MWKPRFASIALLVFWSGLVSPSQAHSPYFGQSERIDHPDFGVVEFAVLYGDGIFFSDPSQVVVFDEEGKLLAATPQSAALSIHCNRSDGASICGVYDELRGLWYEPAHELWTRGRIIEENGEPTRDAYPEYIDIEYGFSQRPARFMEKVQFEAAKILAAPIASFLSVLWWAATCSFVVRLFWRWRGSGFQRWPIRGKAIVSGVLSLLAFFGMCFVAAYGWLLQPYSVIFLSFAFFLGALIAAVLTRPKKVPIS